MSCSDIRSNLEEIYQVPISDDGAISKITELLLPEIEEWKNRPLGSIYPVLLLDAVYFKLRE